jgi:molybdate transport system substrate-binding protein
MRSRTIRRLLLCACWATLFASFALPTAAASTIVAAAASVQFPLQDIAAAFTRKTGEKLKLTFGSSGNLQRQILQGAPFELFLSADERYVRDLYRAGLTVDAGTLYALGRIVLITTHLSELSLDPELEGLAQALDTGRIARFAIANPEHAPYGIAAMQALQAAGLWQRIRPHLVLGENVAQATQFALSGNAEGGIVAYSLALKTRDRADSHYVLIPANRHKPLRHRMVLLKGAGATARQFYAFLQSPSAQAAFHRYGFDRPGS